MIDSLEELIARARQLGPARIAVIEAHDPDVLESLAQAEPLGLALPTLIGKPAKIEEAARKVGYNLRPESLISSSGEDASIRQGIDLVREGRADLLMKGKVTTANLIRGVLDKERGAHAGRRGQKASARPLARMARRAVQSSRTGNSISDPIRAWISNRPRKIGRSAALGRSRAPDFRRAAGGLVERRARFDDHSALRGRSIDPPGSRRFPFPSAGAASMRADISAKSPAVTGPSIASST